MSTKRKWADRTKDTRQARRKNAASANQAARYQLIAKGRGHHDEIPEHVTCCHGPECKKCLQDPAVREMFKLFDLQKDTAAEDLERMAQGLSLKNEKGKAIIIPGASFGVGADEGDVYDLYYPEESPEDSAALAQWLSDGVEISTDLRFDNEFDKDEYYAEEVGACYSPTLTW